MMAKIVLLVASALGCIEAAELHEAVRACDISQVARLISSDVSVNEVDRARNTPLQEAVRAGKPQCVFLLLQAGANRYLVNNAGQTAHLIARLYGEGVVRDQMLALLDRLELVKPGVDSKPWSLQYVALRGKSELVALLLDLGAAPNIMDTDGNTPLGNAARKGYYSTVQLLLDHGANISIRDSSGYLPLHDAALGGNADVMRTLIASGADLSAVTRDSGETALHIAASWGRVDVVRLLLAAGASTVAKDVRGRTPLEVAVQNNQNEVISVLTASKQ